MNTSKPLPIFRLRLFGTPSLERADGNAVTGGAAQRHRLALLAVLAEAHGNRMSRDKLMALLWPESDAERGRNLLKVSAYTLRKALGESALVTTGDDLSLNSDVVETDVGAFTAALARGDRAAAVALYAGPFLDGFFVSDAPDLEEWIARERRRLADEHARALEALAEQAERDADGVRAAEWWKARAEADPLDSRVAMRVIQALDASGNRSAALQHAQGHRRRLEAELGSAAVPDALRALEERLRREPAVVSAPPPSPAPPLPRIPEQDIGRPAPAVAVPPTRTWARWLVPALLVLLVVAVWAAVPHRDRPGRSIVVLPFVNMSPTPDNAYFADGLTEEIITRLAAVPSLTVISRTSAMHYKGTRQALGEIARELHVSQVLEGSVRRADGRVRITVQLIDAASDAHVWAENFEYDQSEILRAQEDVARAVARVLELDVGEQAKRQLARRGTDNAQANELYQRGRALWQTRTNEGHVQAIRLYEQAIALDSTYADAYAGLADAYLTAWQHNALGLSEAESFARMRSAAERALALDEESAAAHTSFAIVLWWQKNWPGAMRELRRSLELNPGQAMTRGWYGLVLRATGNREEAVREVLRSTELDPYASPVRANVGWQCYADRDYACTIDHYRRAVELSPFAQAYLGLALGESQLGRNDSALAHITRAVALAPQRADLVADLAYIQARTGRTTDALTSLRRAEGQPDVEPFNVGRAFVALGAPDSAFAWLGRASWQWPHRASLDDPALDPVRNDPRFGQLRARVMREMGVSR